MTGVQTCALPILGVIYSLVAPSLRLVQVVQMLLGAFTVLLVFEVARRAFDGQTAWLAAGLWACFPLPIFYEAQVTTHGLEPVLGAVLLLLWILALRNQPHLWQRLLAAGGMPRRLDLRSGELIGKIHLNRI